MTIIWNAFIFTSVSNLILCLDTMVKQSIQRGLENNRTLKSMVAYFSLATVTDNRIIKGKGICNKIDNHCHEHHHLIIISIVTIKIIPYNILFIWVLLFNQYRSVLSFFPEHRSLNCEFLPTTRLKIVSEYSCTVRWHMFLCINCKILLRQAAQHSMLCPVTARFSTTTTTMKSTTIIKIVRTFFTVAFGVQAQCALERKTKNWP